MGPVKMKRYLKHLGHYSYARYLQSPDWAWIRERVLERDKHECQCCLKRATQVHHLKYTPKNLAGKGDWWTMMSICAWCHKEAHDGNTMSKARRVLSSRMLRIRGIATRQWIAKMRGKS